MAFQWTTFSDFFQKLAFFNSEVRSEVHWFTNDRGGSYGIVSFGRVGWSGCSNVFGTTVGSDEELYSGLLGGSGGAGCTSLQYWQMKPS